MDNQRKEEGNTGTPTRIIAGIEGISIRRVNQIYRQYKETGEIPELRKPGRPEKNLSKEEIKAIKDAFEEYRCNAIVKNTKRESMQHKQEQNP